MFKPGTRLRNMTTSQRKAIEAYTVRVATRWPFKDHAPSFELRLGGLHGERIKVVTWFENSKGDRVTADSSPTVGTRGGWMLWGKRVKLWQVS